MEIIKLPSVVEKERRKKRSCNIKKNKNCYRKLKEMMVPNELKLGQFRKYYHSVPSKKEKEVLIGIGLDPLSIEGLKYAGDCRRYSVRLGQDIL